MREASSASAEGVSAASYQPVRRQVILCVAWLLTSLVIIFLLGLTLDVGIIIGGPIALLAITVSSIILIIRGARVGRQIPGDDKSRWTAGSAAFLAAMLFALLLTPVARFGGHGQAYAVLAFNEAKYQSLMTKPELTSDKMRTDWLRVGGSGPSRIWAFGYGGFLSIDLDIVFDPLDRPEQRAVSLLSATTASCRWLRSHYYDCTLDY